VSCTVSDTGPLITWPRAHRLPLLLEVYPDIVVPKAVAEELEDPRRLFRPGHDLLDRGWIRKHELSIQKDSTLPRGLGAGEREAIDLARQMNSMLLIDDWEARKAAEERGIRTTSTLETLALCKKLGLLPAVRPLLEEMIAKGFWLAGDRRARFLKQVGES